MRKRNRKPLTICLVAGDVSGDQNGGRLARALADFDPAIRLIGVGGRGDGPRRRRGHGRQHGILDYRSARLFELGALGPARMARCARPDQSVRPDLVVLIDAETLN